MKKYTKEELAEMAQGYFEHHPSVKKFIATEDGQFFTESNESAAKDHNSKVVKGQLVEITKEAEKASSEVIFFECIKGEYE